MHTPLFVLQNPMPSKVVSGCVYGYKLVSLLFIITATLFKSKMIQKMQRENTQYLITEFGQLCLRLRL
jgi:hypothetical protein